MTLHVDVLLGISFGVLVGILPAFVVGVVSFGLDYATDYVPGKALAVGVAVPLAAVVGYAVDFVVATQAAVPRVVVAGVVTVLLALYAGSQGRALAERFPRDLSSAERSKRTLTAAALSDVDGAGHVVLSTTGAVEDLEGYPPLPPELRTAIENDAWRLPADLPLAALETRLADRLETNYGLSAVSVSVDDRGRVGVAAAPPTRDLAERVADDHSAVSVDTLLPTGLDRGDAVTVATDDGTYAGSVLSARSTAAAGDQTDIEGSITSVTSAESTATGGRGRVTISLPTSEARAVLAADDARITVRPRDPNPAFTAFSHLRQAGREIKKLVLTDRRRERVTDASSPYEIVCVRDRSEAGADWRFDPDDVVADDQEAFVVGPTDGDSTRPFVGDTAADAGGEPQ